MNREKKFSQSTRYPPDYHDQVTLGNVGEYPSQQSSQNVVTSSPRRSSMPGEITQHRDQPGHPEPGAQSSESPSLYSLPKNVLQRVKNCWVELGRKGCGVYRATSERCLGSDSGVSNGLNENTPPSVGAESGKMGKAVSLEDYGNKENNAMWSERLEDYKFLSGDVPPTEKRYTSIFGRQKSDNTQNHKHSIAEWRIWPRNNDEGYKCSACKHVIHKSCITEVAKCQGCAVTAPVHTNRGGPQVVPDPRFAPPIPQPPQINSIVNDYWDLKLSEYPWWVETMSRVDSTSLLTSTPGGTFLVRWSDNHHQPILSIKALGEVKHMRINRQEDNGYFLSEAHFFKSINEIINYHQTTPLSESFQGLEHTLIRPVYETGLVSFTYSAPATSKNHLSMLNGERVVIINHDGETRGWWKGRIGNRVGYFPREYVTLDLVPFM